MARYYFQLWKETDLECPDEEGAEFASLEEAYLEAFASARELWHELLRTRRDPRLFTFVILGVDRSPLTELPFWEILESCRPVRPRTPMTISQLTAATREAFKEARENAREARRLSSELRDELRSVHRTIATLPPAN